MYALRLEKTFSPYEMTKQSPKGYLFCSSGSSPQIIGPPSNTNGLSPLLCVGGSLARCCAKLPEDTYNAGTKRKMPFLCVYASGVTTLAFGRVKDVVGLISIIISFDSAVISKESLIAPIGSLDEIV